MSAPETSEHVEPLRLVIDPGSATSDEISDLLILFSEAYRAFGGSGVTWSQGPDASLSRDKPLG